MPVDRQHMLTVLARDGMGWEETRETDEEGFPITNSNRAVFVAYESHVFIFPLCAPDHTWDPFTDWRDAFELLVAMRGKPEFRRFGTCLMWKTEFDWIQNLSPALIAQAAFEALVWEKKEAGRQAEEDRIEVPICPGCTEANGTDGFAVVRHDPPLCNTQEKRKAQCPK